MGKQWKVEIAQHDLRYLLKKKAPPVYYTNPKDYPNKYKKGGYYFASVGKGKKKQKVLVDSKGNRVIKNKNSVGKPVFWKVNGQQLYNAALHFRTRSAVSRHFHKYFSKYIMEQLEVIPYHNLSISCDIYELEKNISIDISNLWLLEKWYEDSLQECGIISEDAYPVVAESGRKRYHIVDNEEDRKLVFTIKVLEDD